MTAGEAKFIEWALLILGAALAFSGWRTIRKRRTLADGREYQGKAALRLGWLWIVLGAILILAVLLDIPLLKAFGRIFMESES